MRESNKPRLATEGILLACLVLLLSQACGLRREKAGWEDGAGDFPPAGIARNSYPPGRSRADAATGGSLSGDDASSPTFALPNDITGPLTLEDAINRALLENRGIADASEQVESARYSLITARSAFELKIVPNARTSIGGGTGTDTTRDFGAGFRLEKRLDWGTQVSAGPRASVIENSVDNWQGAVDFSLRQPLLKGLGREVAQSGVRGAEYSARSVRRSFYRTRVNTVVSAVENVYNAIRQRELVRLNEESAERLRGHVESAKAKEQLGLISPIDAYRASIQLKQAEDNLVTAREAFLDALDNLKILLNFQMDREIEIVAPLEYNLFTIDEEEAIRIALAERVEILQSEDAVQEADRLSRVAKKNILPDLDLLFSYTRLSNDDSFGDSWNLDRETWNLGLRTTADVARTAERAAFQQSLLNLRSTERQLTLTRDTVIRQVKQSARNLRRAEHRIRLQSEQIAQAESQLELAKVKFDLGKGDNFDVIEAEIQWQRAKVNLLTVVIDYIVETYRVRAIMGTLLEKPETF